MTDQTTTQTDDMAPILEAQRARALQTRQQTTARTLAGLIDAYHLCYKHGNGWIVRHRALIEQIAADVLPSGSGIDSGTTVDLDHSTSERIVLVVPYHHMDQHGGYCGWSTYGIVVTPSLIHGLSIRVTGRDRLDTKDYLAQTFEHVLSAVCEQTYDPATGISTFDLVRS